MPGIATGRGSNPAAAAASSLRREPAGDQTGPDRT